MKPLDVFDATTPRVVRSILADHEKRRSSLERFLNREHKRRERVYGRWDEFQDQRDRQADRIASAVERLLNPFARGRSR